MKTLDYYQHVSLQMNALDYLGLSLHSKHPVKSFAFWMAVFVKVFIGVFFLVIPTGGQLIYLVKLLFSDGTEISEIAGVLNLVLTEMLTSYKLLNLRLSRNAFDEVIEEFSQPNFQHYLKPQQNILEKAIQKSRKLYVFFLCSASTDVFGHVVIAPGLNRFRSLPLKMDLIFFDVNDPRYFNYICVYQILYKPWIVIPYIAIISLPWSLMCFGISQLDVLIHNFENMKELVKATMVERECNENEAFRIIFKRQVLHHTDVVRFIKKLQTAFSAQFSASLFMSICINGTTTMQFISINSPMENIAEVMWVSAYLIVFILMLYVDTYFGNKVTEKAANLSTAVYACPWFNLDNKMKRNLIIFIGKTQRPLVITAAKTIPVSLATFTKSFLLFATVIKNVVRYACGLLIIASRLLNHNLPHLYRNVLLILYEEVMNWTYKGFAILNQMK